MAERRTVYDERTQSQLREYQIWHAAENRQAVMHISNYFKKAGHRYAQKVQ